MLKSLAKCTFAIMLILFSISLVVYMKYDISVTEYLADSVPLTRQEQQYLKEKNVLRFGVDTEAAPFSFYNDETGKIEGLIVDYMAFAALELGVEVEYIPVAQGEIADSIKEQQIDMTDLFVNPKEKKRYLSTQSLYSLEGIMVTPYQNRTVTQYKDMEGRTLLLMEGDFMESKIMGVMPKNQTMDIQYVENVKDGLKLLMDGEADALAANEAVIDYYAEELGITNDLRQVGDAVYKESVAFAVNIYDSMLYNILNKEVLQLKKKHVLSDLQEKWLGSSTPIITDSISVQWAQWIIIFSVSTVILLMIWESVLNRRIDQKTREIQIERNNLQTIIDNINSLVAVVNEEDIITQCNAYGKSLLKDKGGGFLGCGMSTVPMLNDLYELYCQSADEPYIPYQGRYYSIFVRTVGAEKKNRLIQIEDCTEKVFTERKFRQESKMIAVGQLSAGLAHEIRNPLGLIKNYSYILRDFAEDDMASHSLDVIGESADRIDHLIENLLRFSRLSNDKPARLNVEQLLQNIIDLERKKTEKQNIMLSLLCPKDLAIYAREETIKIVAFNLINNAIESFHELQREQRKLEIRAKAEAGALVLEVEDNGSGMSQETMENIFNPFFTTKDTGTGLGLYIVSSELEKVGGQISVKSELGQGTVFTVTIPGERKNET